MDLAQAGMDLAQVREGWPWVVGWWVVWKASGRGGKGGKGGMGGWVQGGGCRTAEGKGREGQEGAAAAG